MCAARLRVTVSVHEAVHGVSVPGGHHVVQQRVDGGAEVVEDGGHQVEVLGQVVQKIQLCIAVSLAVEVAVVFCTVSVPRRLSESRTFLSGFSVL